MNRDTVIYCSNIEQLKEELTTQGYFDEESQDFIEINTITPRVKNGVETLALVRDNKLDLALFPSLTELGTYEEVFADNAKHDTYKRVYPYDVPVTYVDEDGTTQEYYRPQRFCEIA